ncbi:metallophosphoesterase family protein [Planctomycetaceae bacterium SH139]
MTGRLIAIGDIHGCSRALLALLDAIEPAADDTIVTLGDYIDRGPDSRGVIERLCQLARETRLIPLMGNHEQMMLDVIEGAAPYQSWFPHGGVATLDSYEFDGNLDFLPAAHRKFLDSLVDYYETDTHFFLHANYDPDAPLNEQTVDMIRWRSLRDGIPDPHYSGRIAVVGHTANHEAKILDLGHLIALDTFCYGGGVLSAIDVDSGQIWQASEEGRPVRW